jgi:hypothetical protein
VGSGCTNNYPNLSFSIFDRYGRVIAKYRTGQKWVNIKVRNYRQGITDYTLKLNNNKDNRVGHFAALINRTYLMMLSTKNIIMKKIIISFFTLTLTLSVTVRS